MDLVVDANILFAALIRDGATADLLFRDDLHLYAPEYLFTEFGKYRETVLEKTHRSDEDFDHLVRVLQRRINIIPAEEIQPFMDRARKITPDPDDAQYIALALRLHADIWSNDKRLKEQDTVEVHSTGDLLEIIRRD